MRTALAKVAKYHFGPNAVTPLTTSQDSTDSTMPEMKLGTPAIIPEEKKSLSKSNTVTHGFSLNAFVNP